MKKLFAIVIALGVVASSLCAHPVSRETAQRVACNFWTMNHVGDWDGMKDVTSCLGVEGMYAFARQEGGYVIVAADDCALPILGYSPDAVLGGPLPENMTNWLKGYEWEITQMQRNGVEGGEVVKTAWAHLLKGVPPSAPLSTPVAPMIQTTWGQGTYYNTFCPVDNTTRQHTATGCVATATAQVMKYWNHPLQGRGSKSYTHPSYGQQSANFGSTTYDWSNMPNVLNANSTTQQVQAVATLMYHVGVSIVTNYAPSSSGSSAEVIARAGIEYPCVENALRRYFDYSPELYGARLFGTSEECWKAMLKNEMDSARPVIYSGYDFSGGHCFVCDGYDSQDHFHFNWGWGGMSDGYFAIGSLNPSVGGIGTNASSSFNLDNTAVFGIRPAVRNSTTTAVVTAVADDPAHATISGAGTYNNFSDLVTLTVSTTDGYRFDGWTDGNTSQPRQFYANGDVSLTAHIRPVVGDTITYCNGAYAGNVTNRYFGIKVEAANLPSGQSLKSIQLYNVYAGNYAIRIYSGGNYSPNTLVYEETFHLEGTNRWETLRLSQTVAIDNSQPLWIIAYCRDNSMPASLATYGGNQNGGWVSANGVVWSQFVDLTVMLKAIFAQPTDVVVAVASADTTQGVVTGSGRYALGETCTIAAIPIGDNVFDHWNDGSTENPRSFSASANVNYTAYFSNCAVSTLPLTQDFGGDLGCWTTYSASTENAAEMGIYSSSSWWGTVAYFKFCSQRVDYNYDQYLISPRLVVPGAINLSLSYSCYSSIAETFQIVYSTTDNHPSSFTHVLRSGSCSLSTWDTMQTVIPAEAKYVAIHYTTQHGYYLYIDDIRLEGQPLPNYVVTVVSESPLMGSVAGGGSYQEGSVATISATANPCYEFLHWQDGNTQNPRTIVVNGDVTYSAAFSPVSYSGVEVLSACDSVYWNGSWYYENLVSESITTTTEQGCDSVVTLVLTIRHSTYWDTVIYSDGPFEMDGVTYAHSDTILRQLSSQYGCDSVVRIILHISALQYVITAEAADPSRGSVVGGGVYGEGEWVELTAIPAEGYIFHSWSNGIMENPYRFQATQDVSITARFSPLDGIGLVSDRVQIVQQGRTICVAGAEGKAVAVCDVLGRTIAATSEAAERWEARIPHPGMFFVRIEGLPVRKVVAR